MKLNSAKLILVGLIFAATTRHSLPHNGSRTHAGVAIAGPQRRKREINRLDLK
jgi:hypothetical protein